MTKLIGEELLPRFPVGIRVTTPKGCTGTVVGYSKWRNYADVKVRKESSGLVVSCHVINLERMPSEKVATLAPGPSGGLLEQVMRLNNRVSQLERDVALLKKVRL